MPFPDSTPPAADNRTLRDLYDECISAQDACNLSGVIHSWSRSISRLRDLYPSEGTAFFNTHPLSILWASKAIALTHSGLTSHSHFSRAYDTALSVLNENTPTTTPPTTPPEPEDPEPFDEMTGPLP